MFRIAGLSASWNLAQVSFTHQSVLRGRGLRRAEIVGPPIEDVPPY